MKIPAGITEHPLWKKADAWYWNRRMRREMHRGLDVLIERDGCTRFVVVGGKLTASGKGVATMEIHICHNLTDQKPETRIQLLAGGIAYINRTEKINAMMKRELIDHGLLAAGDGVEHQP